MSDGANNPVRYFGRQVRKERLATGWTLAEFGQRIGYDPAHISRIESGKRPATAVFAQMCDQAFPHRNRWFSEFYEESRTWIATPPWFRSWVEHEQRTATLRNWFPGLVCILRLARAAFRLAVSQCAGAGEPWRRTRVSRGSGGAAHLRWAAPVAGLASRSG